MNIYFAAPSPCGWRDAGYRTFQQALDELAQAGGGRLVVDCGRYALGGLRIGSNTCLWLSPGAELIVSENYDDFAQATALSRAESSDRAFLYAVDAQNITICGGGEIYGSADGWFSRRVDAMGYRTPAGAPADHFAGELPSRPAGKYHRTTCPDVDNSSGLLYGGVG